MDASGGCFKLVVAKGPSYRKQIHRNHINSHRSAGAAMVDSEVAMLTERRCQFLKADMFIKMCISKPDMRSAASGAAEKRSVNTLERTLSAAPKLL
ncbi:hypothetical protein AV530_014470 [Patagioenas fasciata monilis]|uniref:Uncharacterized protein n=1 Tax=Patagioenas fasciata monilis TaxID=372326 RepID=A0A1V4KC56_PATFA|nr:hypothetical protein AV530_014470 [Patagioenas fasciata monilis]